ncbi:unnamed protein product, partial [Prorocentrum cordatum]
MALLPRLPLLGDREEHGPASCRGAGRQPLGTPSQGSSLSTAASRRNERLAPVRGAAGQKLGAEEFPQKGAMSARAAPAYPKSTGWGPSGGPSAMRRQSGLRAAGAASIVRQWASASARGKADRGALAAPSPVSPYRGVDEGRAASARARHPAQVPRQDHEGSGPSSNASCLLKPSSALLWPAPGCALPEPLLETPPPRPEASKDNFKGSVSWFLSRSDEATELFSESVSRAGSKRANSKTGSAPGALLAPRGAAKADPLVARLGRDVGKLAGEQFCKTLAKELNACQDEHEVDKLCRLVQKVTNASSADTFSTTGALAYRFREALRPLRESSVGASLGYSERLWVNRAIEKRVQRRRDQIANGEVDRAETSSAPRPARASGRRASRVTWQGTGLAEGGQACGAGAEAESGEASPREAAEAAWQEGAAEASSPGSRRGSDDSGSDREGGGSASRSTRCRRRRSRRSRSSILGALAAHFVTESEEFTDDEASKAYLTSTFKLGPLKGVEAFRIWRKVFEALKVDGEVHHTDLTRALQMAGFQAPDQACVCAAKESVTHWSTLTKAQFNEFAVAFERENEKLQDAMFAKFDIDGSGQIDRGELESLLENFGIVPMRHILDEVLNEVDEDGSGNVGLDEFRKVFEILRMREGFSKEEFSELTELFDKLDLDGSGEMDIRELTVLLGYLDYNLGTNERDVIVKEVDTDGSGELCEVEFLLFMRRCRQIEMRKLTDAFKKLVPEADGVVCFHHMIDTFTEMGYEVDVDATWEAAQSAGVTSKEARLDSSDFWKVLTECRAREWFTSQELQQIGDIFEQVDVGGSGEVDIVQVDKALLGLGLSLRTELFLYLVGKVDLDNSGMLNLMEFRKLVRMYRNGQAELVRTTFVEFADQNSRWLSVADSWKAFNSLGLVKDSIKSFHEVQALGPLDLRAFLRAARSFERGQELYREQNSGFGEQAVHDLELRFRKFDADGSGALESRELVPLVEEVLPGVATLPENRARVMKMMAEAQGGASTESEYLAQVELKSYNRTFTHANSTQIELNFQQFLKLLSLIRGFKLERLYKEEQRVIEECSLTGTEVQQLRELFLESASGDGCMTTKDLWLLFRNICPLGDR